MGSQDGSYLDELFTEKGYQKIWRAIQTPTCLTFPEYDSGSNKPSVVEEQSKYVLWKITYLRRESFTKVAIGLHFPNFYYPRNADYEMV